MKIANCKMDQDLRWLLRLYAAGLSVLLLATLSLWSGRHAFPQVPFFKGTANVPEWIDIVLLLALICGALSSVVLERVFKREGEVPAEPPPAHDHPLNPTILRRLKRRFAWKSLGNAGRSKPHRRGPLSPGGGSGGPSPSQRSHVEDTSLERWRIVWLLMAVGISASAILDQHRAQVWAYHLIVAGLIAAFSNGDRPLPRLRWLTIGIYAWSAISKCDASFVAGPGKLLWEGLLHAINIDAALLPAPLNRSAPWLMPAGELLTAIALASPRGRRVGLWLSIVMHTALLLAVGPLGLRHEAGVQIWNVLFIVQNIILFRSAASHEKLGFSLQRQDQTPLDVEATSAEAGLLNTPPRSKGDRAAAWLLLFVLLMPAFQPWNLWDVWPSWAVYSTRGGWTTIFVHHDDVELLPTAARPFVGAPPPLSDWHPVDVDAWSLAELHCPVYPQPRFRLGVAAALSERARVRVERRSPPNRWTGKTTIEMIDVSGGKLPDIVEREFWLNVCPRAAARKRDG